MENATQSTSAMNQDSELAARLNDLETQLAYQDDTLAEMEKTILHQQNAIQALERKLSLLSEYLKSLREPAVKPLNEEAPPPHY